MRIEAIHGKSIYIAEKMIFTNESTPKVEKFENILSKDDTNVRFGIITALPEEFASVCVLLEDYRDVTLSYNQKQAGNRYVLGYIPSNSGGRHRIALSLLPKMGNNFAAIITNTMLKNFLSINNIIVCGIAGGIPSVSYRGDVVVSTKGVLQYDFIKQEMNIENGKTLSSLRAEPLPCSSFLLEAVEYMKGNEIISGVKWQDNIFKIDYLTDKSYSFTRPSFKMEHIHVKNDAGKYVTAERSPSNNITVHYEKIASANILLKQPLIRDTLHNEHNVYGVEMESSGVSDATLLNNTGYSRGQPVV